MLASDQLLVFLIDGSGDVSARMAAAGYSEAEIRAAWNYARQAGFIESSGLGADRITAAGRARAQNLR